MRFRNSLNLLSFLGRQHTKRWFYPNLKLKPIVAELFLTDNCNLRCISCNCWRDVTRDELSRSEWFDVIDQLSKLKFVKLNFTGGEALLRRDLPEIVAYARNHTSAALHLNSNGLLLNPTKANELIDAGIKSVNISLDGATASMHNSIRGRSGAYETTLGHLEELVQRREKCHLKLRMCFTVMQNNICELPAIARLAQKLQVPLFFNVLTDRTFLFRGYDIVQLGAIDHGALGSALNEVLALKKQNPKFLPSYSVLCYIADHFKDQLQAQLPCVESNLKLMIHSQGQVGGCWAHDPEFSVRSQRLADILDSDRYASVQTDLFFKRCQGCGSNHALNLKLAPRPAVYDLLWKMNILKRRRPLFG